MLLGCIADDLTGATDLASMLVRGGMRAVLRIGVPGAGEKVPEAEAVVVALKSRTIPAREAVAQSRGALAWLRAAGARQVYFKYCSTFDSTEEGNIGPVMDALLADLEAPLTVACPALPENGRTVYRGHLFVGDVLLSESSLRAHPLTPMTDANLVRVLGRQSRGRIGLIGYNVVRRGPGAVRRALDEAQEEGLTCAIVDAVEDQHLADLGAACADLPLVTGGSGLALGLPENFRRAGLLGARSDAATPLPRVEGGAAIVAGSCSAATQAQVAALQREAPSFYVDVEALAEGRDVAAEALAWAEGQEAPSPLLVYSTAPPEARAAAQARLGRQEAGALVEKTLARVAEGLVAQGVRTLVVAGGETSGAVVRRLGIDVLRIGPAITPGVPWTVATQAGEPLLLALKSGNFGGPDFFEQALSPVRERSTSNQ